MKEINGMHVYEDIDAMFKNVKELTPEEIKEITKNCEPKIGEAKRLQSGTIIQEMTVCGVDSEPVLVRYGSEDVLVLQQAVLGKFSDLRWALIMLGVKDKDDFRTMINNTGTKIKLDLDDNNIWEYFSKGNQFTLDIVRYMSEERSFELEKRSPDSMCYKLYREFFLEQEQVSPEMQKVFRTNDYVNLLIAGKALPKNIIFGLFNSVLTLP
ncbi:MAG: hypothetical protein JXB15_07895 [Anaerolineales bacterium]|nr:hypothetical protein [Anaerolineales bacterium]